MVSHQGVSPQDGLSNAVSYQDGLSSGGLSSGVLLSGWPLFRMIFLQVELSSGSSLNRVISQQDGLSLG